MYSSKHVPSTGNPNHENYPVSLAHPIPPFPNTPKSSHWHAWLMQCFGKHWMSELQKLRGSRFAHSSSISPNTSKSSHWHTWLMQCFRKHWLSVLQTLRGSRSTHSTSPFPNTPNHLTGTHSFCNAANHGFSERLISSSNASLPGFNFFATRIWGVILRSTYCFVRWHGEMSKGIFAS